jgi:hypothetical protein
MQIKNRPKQQAATTDIRVSDYSSCQQQPQLHDNAQTLN